MRRKGEIKSRRGMAAEADLGGGGGGPGGPDPPLSYMKNDVIHTAIYAAFCMLPSRLHIVLAKRGLYQSNTCVLTKYLIARSMRVSRN